MGNKNNKTLNRRQFIQQSLMGAMGATTLAQSLGLSALVGSSQLSAMDNDYKALVYIFLAGGNDSYNMIAPQGSGILRDRYESGRRNIAHPVAQMHNLTLAEDPQIYGGESYNEFGMHPDCGDLANIFNSGELSVVCNVGSLVMPTSRQQYLDKTVTLPPQLFSHADQQKQFQSEPLNPFRFGWGGRMAELLSDYNSAGLVSPLMSVSGLNSFQVTRDSVINPYVMSKNGVVALRDFNGDKQSMVEAYMAAVSSSSHLMEQKYAESFVSAKEAVEIVNASFDLAAGTGVDYDAIFEATGASDTQIGKRLKTVAKMIAGRAATGNDRPVYFVKMNGFDAHQNVLADHQQLMTELNAAILSFRNTLTEQGDFDKTLSFIGSEFGRTFTPNGGNDSAGTDHAWGGHVMMMGGMVNGSRFFGTHPDLQLGQGLDVDNGRGRWIPTTSVAQCSAVVADWMGVPRDDLGEIFPSLGNFDSPFEAAANLDIIQTGAVV